MGPRQDIRHGRSTKGGGIFPLQARRSRRRRARSPPTLNKGRGNIPPPRRRVTWPVHALIQRAQQREGEYSPSKVTWGPNRWLATIDRSTKGGGIFPLQGHDSGDQSNWHAAAQQREGEYSPSKLMGRACTPVYIIAQQREGEYSPSKSTAGPTPANKSPAQQREGEYSPSKRRTRQRQSPPPLTALNKGRGNIPPPSSVEARSLTAGSASAQQREGEYSPSK